MPDILKQVGPQQYQFLKEQIGSGVEGKADAADDDDDDDVPELVGTFEDVNKWARCASWVQQEWASIPGTLRMTRFNEQAPLEIKLSNPWDHLGVACVSLRA